MRERERERDTQKGNNEVDWTRVFGDGSVCNAATEAFLFVHVDMSTWTGRRGGQGVFNHELEEMLGMEGGEVQDGWQLDAGWIYHIGDCGEGETGDSEPEQINLQYHLHTPVQRGSSSSCLCPAAPRYRHLSSLTSLSRESCRLSHLTSCLSFATSRRTSTNTTPCPEHTPYSKSTIKHNHPSGYAASRINSSSGAENGTGAPCSTTFASTGSRLLGNSVGSTVLSANPSVCGVSGSRVSLPSHMCQ